MPELSRVCLYVTWLLMLLINTHDHVTCGCLLLCRVDKSALDGLSKGLSGKLGATAADAPQDAVAVLWSYASLNYRPDAQVGCLGGTCLGFMLLLLLLLLFVLVVCVFVF